MSTRVIVGRGGTASATAIRFAESGDRVRMVSRGGLGPQHPNIELIALDARDTDRLADVATGAATVVNAAAPAYHTWPEELPPLFRAIMAATERCGADYVMLGNLYGYGQVDGALTESSPLGATGPKGKVRAEMWREAEEATRVGRLRATEVRAGQFLGTGAVSEFSLLVQPKVMAGRLAVVPQALDKPHSFTATADAAAALVALARDERAWGRAWHAPMITKTLREVAERLAAVAGAPAPRLAVLSDRELALLGLTDPFWNELFETEYMAHGEFVADDSAIRETFAVQPTRLDDVLAAAIGEHAAAA